MLMIFVMIAAFWGIGFAMGAPVRQRWIMTIGLLALVLIAQLALPDGHPIRMATGQSPALWALILGFGGLIYLYRLGLNALKRRQAAAEPVADASQGMGETELERYARHIVLREIGGVGQTKLHQSKVLVIGAGGLGSPALMYLAAAGVGTIGIIDDDTVDATNLQRQIVHRDAAIGMGKVQSAADTIKALNPYVQVRPYARMLTEDIARDLFEEYDLIVDGTDSFATRRLSNKTARALGKPLVFGALSQWEGQVSVFGPDGPCYHCVFPEDPDPSLAPSCAEAGVFSPLPGVIGTMMAAEAVKCLTGAGRTLTGRLLIYDALDAQTRVIGVKQRKDCPICSANIEKDA